MKKSRELIIVFFLSVLAFATAAAQEKWKGTIVKEGDVTVVRNPREPIYMTPVLEFKEELSIGGPDAQNQDVFNRIREFVVDDAGNFYISDFKENHIKIFDKTGHYLRTVGRPGQGPGEFDGIWGLSIVSATGELVVCDVIKRQLSYFKTNGAFLRALHLEESRISYARLDSKGNIYAGQTFVDTGTSRWELRLGEFRLAVLDHEGKLIQVLAREPQSEPNVLRFFMPNSYWTLDSSDNLVYGYSKEYEILFFEAGTHKLFKKVRKDFNPVPVTDEDMKQFKKPDYSAMKFVFAKERPAFLTFFLSDTGHLFVETFEKANNGYFIYDIFDKDGRLLARMPLKLRGLKISNGKYYALEEDEDGFQCVKRYAVRWIIK
jgi:hypothetical protein